MDNLTPEINRLTADLIKYLAGSFWEKVKVLTHDQTNKLKIGLRLGMDAYVTDTLLKVSYVKTILYRDKDVPISSFYVETFFHHNRGVVTQEEFFGRLDTGNKVIICGLAGCGKSIFMRYATIHLLKLDKKRIPVFVELRFINHGHSSILHYLHKEILSLKLRDFDETVLNYGLSLGIFALILDGFDELDFDRRSQYLLEIAYLRNRYKNLIVIISTRPDEGVLSLEGFSVFHVSSLAKYSAIDLVWKLEFEEEAKDRFAIALDETIYESHTEFASNPLLLTMLLLTYDQVGNLPSKMHIFYNQAFEILVFKHDRLKSLYTRKTYSDLDIEQIRRLFSFVCAKSYFRKAISFTELELDELIRDGCEYNQIDCATELIKNDLIHSFSMLKRDGLYLTFVHRSFQEYFAAYFVLKSTDIHLREAIDEIAGRGITEQSINLLFDMAPEKCDEYWLIPTLKEIVADFRRYAEEPHVFIRTFFDGLRIVGDKVDLVGRNRNGFVLDTALRMAQPRLRLDHTILPEVSAKPSFQTDRTALEKFFGSRNPYSGRTVEPRSDDDRWLKQSQVVEYIRTLRETVDLVISELERLAATRRSKAGLFIKKASTEENKTWTEEFEVRGEPKQIVDQRTGRKTLAPSTKYVRRNIVPDK